MKIKQAYLRGDQGEVMTTWIDDRPDLKQGVYIYLKDFKPGTKWLVKHLYDDVRDAEDFDFHRKWDNNNYDKHVGLGV